MCLHAMTVFLFFFSSRRRHTRYWRDWSSDVCSSDLHRAPRGLRGFVFAPGQEGRPRLRLLDELLEGSPLVRCAQDADHVARFERNLGSGVRESFVAANDRHHGRARLAPYTNIADGLSDYRAVLMQAEPLRLDHARGPVQLLEKVPVGGGADNRCIELPT